MIAFDTDVLTEILLGDAEYVSRASAIPEIEQTVPIIVIEEIMRGRLNVIRQAEAGNRKSALNMLMNFLRKHSTIFDEFKSFHTLLRLNCFINNGDSKKFE